VGRSYWDKTRDGILMIGVVVGTFGSKEWSDRGRATEQTLKDQTAPCRSVHSHCNMDSLMEARNGGARYLIDTFDVEWLCFLDADDLLDPLYVEKMQEKIKSLDNGDFLIQPSSALVVEGVQVEEAHLIPRQEILSQNWMVIGTLVKASTFTKVGGFADWPIYEDWDLWIRCHRAGAGFATQPEAVYLITRSENSRNSQDRDIQVKYFNEIRKQYIL